MLLKLDDGSTVQVKFCHNNGIVPTARRTCVEVIDAGEIHCGIAYLHPNDRYCKATGRKIALARAIEHLERGMRTQIWKAYFEYIGASYRKKSV